MEPAISLETELRHAVIDRLIAASMRDGTTLQRWRNAGAAPVSSETQKGAVSE